MKIAHIPHTATDQSGPAGSLHLIWFHPFFLSVSDGQTKTIMPRATAITKGHKKVSPASRVKQTISHEALQEGLKLKTMASTGITRFSWWMRENILKFWVGTQVFRKPVSQKGLSNANNLVFLFSLSLVVRSYLRRDFHDILFMKIRLQRKNQEFTSNTTWSFDSSKPQRVLTQSLDARLSLHKSQSLKSTAFAKFQYKRNVSFTICIWKTGLFWAITSQSSDKLVEWFWQQGVLLFFFPSLLNYKRDGEWRWSFIMTVDITSCIISSTAKYWIIPSKLIFLLKLIFYTFTSIATVERPVHLSAICWL